MTVTSILVVNFCGEVYDMPKVSGGGALTGLFLVGSLAGIYKISQKLIHISLKLFN